MKENVAVKLAWAFAAMARLQGVVMDPVRIQAAFSGVVDPDRPVDLGALCKSVDLPDLEPIAQAERFMLPLLCRVRGTGWGVLMDQTPDGRWLFLSEEGQQHVASSDIVSSCYKPDFSALKGKSDAGSFETIFRQSLAKYRGVLMEAVLASVFISVIALATSLFSMQVYDRVIPTQGSATLAVLATGACMAILVELAMKFARSHIMDEVVAGLDGRLSKEIFERLLAVRVDQLPGSVGSLAGQLRGYEQLRSFYTASTLFSLVDLPLGLIFVVVIALIANPVMSLVPVVFGGLAVLAGYVSVKKVDRLAKQSTAASNLKTGLLVEAVEGVETIKAGSGGWKFLSRWIDVSTESIRSDMAMRSISEHTSYFSAMLQQVSYAGTVVVGSWLVMEGKITMGSLIACSILGGRILAPVTMIPGLMVQRAHSRATLEGLEKIYALQTDHHGVERPLTPEKLLGNYELDDVRFAYAGSMLTSVKVDRLHIREGERVAILGPIGAGKSTILRLLSGLYRPQQGRIRLDGLEMGSINRLTLNQQVGYLQQDHRLFVGTLRENLLIGLADPGDEVLKKVMERTGLMRLVAAHPKGLDLPIHEGGRGLSGGQRQLVAFTRLVLCDPNVYLLDEPTASMDDELEKNCLSVLKQELEKNKTMVVVTHKPSLLPLVDRIIVIVGHQIVLDGPRDAVLARLATAQTAPAPAQPAPVASPSLQVKVA